MILTLWQNPVRRALAAMVAANAVAALMLIGWLAASQQASAKTQALSQETVKQFIASFPAVKAVAISQAAEKGKAVASTKDTLTAVIAAVSDKSMGPQVDKVVQAHGFKDAKQWASVGESVGRVYAHLKIGTADGAARGKLDKALAKIEKNDFLSEKQKEKLAKALRGGADAALEPPPEENIAAVKPMVAELEAVVKSPGK